MTRGVRAPTDGSATVWMLSLAGVVVAMLVVVTGLAAAVTARHRASGAADLAALAAAAAAVRGQGGACAEAARVARANGGRLSECRQAGGVVDVAVAVPLRGAFARFGSAAASARAGPAAYAP